MILTIQIMTVDPFIDFKERERLFLRSLAAINNSTPIILKPYTHKYMDARTHAPCVYISSLLLVNGCSIISATTRYGQRSFEGNTSHSLSTNYTVTEREGERE
jgi:hypothetical protein